jgi:hypothetical protein
MLLPLLLLFRFKEFAKAERRSEEELSLVAWSVGRLAALQDIKQ